LISRRRLRRGSCGRTVNNVKEDGPDLPEPRSGGIEEPVLV